MLEIKMHDGPARLGKLSKTETPNLIQLDNSLKILDDEPMPYNVPKTLAEWSVNTTIENARISEETGVGVVHGSKYPDLRVKCALELERLGNQVLMVANPEALMRSSRDLVEIIPILRESINPNTAIYYPFAEPSYMPLLAYMGVDLFDDVAGDFYASLNNLLTSSGKYDLETYRLYDMDTQELKDHNKKIIDFTIKEIRENIRNGTLRNLVEERCCSSPELMTALRLLDRDHTDFILRNTQLY
jgi:7-cyano-7-deazaguanine tRNA-ribosyltransferase